MPILTATELSASTIDYGKFDLQEAVSKNEVFAMVTPKVNNAPIKIKITGEFVADGIVYSDEYKTHNIGLIVDDQEAYAQILGTLQSLNLPKEWEFTDSIKNDTLWLKLKTKGNAYKLKCNAKLNPKKYDEAPFTAGAMVEVVANFKVWLNFENKKVGLYFGVDKITV
jgi:hypothetical protein